MTDHSIQTHRCNHYPDRVLQKPDLAVGLGVCEKTVGNLVKAGKLPEPCWLNSPPGRQVRLDWAADAHTRGKLGVRLGALARCR